MPNELHQCKDHCKWKIIGWDQALSESTRKREYSLKQLGIHVLQGKYFSNEIMRGENLNSEINNEIMY